MEKAPISWLQWGSRAYAARELTVSNATIRQLMAGKKGRYPALRSFLKASNVGVGADGLLVIKNQSGLILKQKA